VKFELVKPQGREDARARRSAHAEWRLVALQPEGILGRKKLSERALRRADYGSARMRDATAKRTTLRDAALLIVLCAAGLSTSAYAQSAGTSVLKLPQDIEFKGPLSGPPQTVVLYGDPTKPGVFVSRVKFSAGWKDPPHWHPDEVRTVVVLSGTLYFGSGDKWDESKFKAYPAGTFYSEPSKAPHFTWAKDGEVIIQITGVGPSGKTFIPQAKQ
jgi:quercetin dioxygenase-like cupin family protein